MRHRSIIDILAEDPDCLALIDRHGAGCSRAHVAETIKRTAQVLPNIAGRLRIMTILPDHPSTALAMAMISDSHTVVPANPAMTLSELESLAKDSGARAAIASEETLQSAESLAARTGLGLITINKRSAEHIADFDIDVVSVTEKAGHDDDYTVILPTSGSTGAPKLVPLRWDQIISSANTIASTLELGADDTAVHALPMFHIGAIVDLFLTPLLSGGRVAFAGSPLPEDIITTIQDSQATWIQGVPTMLHSLIRSIDPDTLLEAGRSLRFIRSVSADLEATRQTEIEKSFGGVPVIQMYGMTETAGQICSNPLPPRDRKQGTVGLATNVDVAILDRYGNPLQQGHEGEVCVRGASVMDGYLNTDNAQHRFGQWLRTGDVGTFDEDGFLSLKGRLKDMINRGGEKISALEIEQHALRIDGVADVACVALPHPTLGEEPALAIVTNPDHELDTEQVRRMLTEHLAAFKVPRRIDVVDKLPRLGSGKVDKISLARELHPLAASPSAAEPRTEAGSIVGRLWAKSLKTAFPGPNDDFFDAGGDSLIAQTFMMELEEAMGRAMPANLLYEAPTFGQLEAKVSALAGTDDHDITPGNLDPRIMTAARRGMAGWRGARRTDQSLLVELQGNGLKNPFFFCTPTEASFVDLFPALSPDRPFYAMRTLWLQDGRSDEAEAKLAEYYAGEIAERQPDGGILLGGHCRGVDMTRRIADALRNAGRRIDLMVEIDSPVDEIYHGPVAQIWSNDHPLFWSFGDPERWNDFRYSGPLYLKKLDVPHREITRGETVTDVAAFLEPLFDTAARGELHDSAATDTPDNHPAATLAKRRLQHAAKIRLAAPKFGTRGEPLTVRVRVTNISDHQWEPTHTSGLRLLARWQRPSGKFLRSLAGGCDIERPVAPGETVSLNFSVPFHHHTTPLLLFVDMVDEGVSWFHETGSKPARKLVIPRYWRPPSDARSVRVELPGKITRVQ